MITDAVVWVKHPRVLFERLCGMGVLERQLFTLAAAGIRRVWIAARPPEAEGMRLPERLEVHWLPRDGDGPLECRPPYLAISGDHFVRREALVDILRRQHPRHVSFHDEHRHGVLQILPTRGGRVLQFEKRRMPAGSCARVAPSKDAETATAWLLEGARKGHDGLMARVFDRRLSLAVTKRLLDTRVMPNHMTLLSSGVGLAGALWLASPDYAHALAGALLVWLHSVLDGCDGELARLRHQESRFGGAIDFWGDNLVHVALFLSLGLGVFRATHQFWALALGAVAAAAAAASAVLAYRISTSRKAAQEGPLFNGLEFEPTPSGTARTLQQVEDFLTQRDFIYLLVLAALFGQLRLFLTAGALGAPVFLLVLLYLLPTGGARKPTAPAKAAPASVALARPAAPITPTSAGTEGLRPARPAAPITPTSAGTEGLRPTRGRIS